MTELVRLGVAEEGRQRKFNPYRRATSETLKGFLGGITIGLLDRSHRKRAPKQRDIQILFDLVEAIVCDLIACHLACHPALIICRSKAKLFGADTQRYYSDLERSKQFNIVVEALAASKLLHLDKALPWMPKPGLKLSASTVEPAEDLIKAIADNGWSFAALEQVTPEVPPELLILKREKDGYWDATQPIGYAETDLTRRLRAEVEDINANLSELDIGMVQSATSSYQPDLQDRQLKRIFLMGSERFDRGGRLAGGFWSNMRKVERERLRINGEPVSILDFGQLNVCLCYAIKGKAMSDGDAYDIKGSPETVSRKNWKQLSNALFFVEGTKTRLPKGLNRSVMGGLTIVEATRLLRDTHKDIAGCFESEIGYELQFHESNILVEILKRCPFGLGLHDGLIIPSSKVEYAMNAMREVFETYTKDVLRHYLPARVGLVS